MARCRSRCPIASACVQAGRPRGLRPGRPLRASPAARRRARRRSTSSAVRCPTCRRGCTPSRRAGRHRRILLVLQGMDTSGKGGIIKHCAGSARPARGQPHVVQGADRGRAQHDFLWRIEPHAPAAGMVGIFDRSHYEDVLIVRVHGLAPDVGDRPPLRRDQRLRAAAGRRAQHDCDQVLPAHLQGHPAGAVAGPPHDPTKHWKYNPGDVDERARWPEYQRAYEIALERCSTDAGALVRRAQRPQVVSQLGDHHLADRAPDGDRPAVAGAGDFDVEEQKARVLTS